jgi:hypothetical protein
MSTREELVKAIEDADAAGDAAWAARRKASVALMDYDKENT